MPTELSEELRFREHTRAPLVTQVRLQFDSFDQPEEGFTADVSVGGMFVTMVKPKPVGTRLRFWLTLPDGGEPVAGYAEVVWMRVSSQGAGRPRGMGIEFRYLENADRERIRAVVERIVEEQDLPVEPLPETAVLAARRAAPAKSPTAAGTPPARPPTPAASGTTPK